MKKILKYTTPLLLVVVLVISLLVTPAMATESSSDTGYLSGVWVFNPSVIWGYMGGFSIDFTCNDVEYNHLTVSRPGGVEYGYISGDCVCDLENDTCCSDEDFDYSLWVFDQAFGLLRESDCLTIDFGDTPQAVSVEFYQWFTLNASPEVAASHGTTSLSIDGESYSLSAYSTNYRPVSLAVTTSGATISCEGYDTVTWEYSGDDLFSGLYDSTGNEYYIGRTYTLGTVGDFLALEFYSFASDVEQTYRVTPVVYISGDELTIYCDSAYTTATIFAIYADDSLVTTISWDSRSSWGGCDLSQLDLPGGSYSITVAGFIAQSRVTEESDPVSYNLLSAGQWTAVRIKSSDPAAWPSSLGTVVLDFTSGGTSFSSMRCSSKLSTGGACLYYGDTLVYGYSSFGQYSGWISDTYAYIYLDTSQAVSQAFYDWFTSSFKYVSQAQSYIPVSVTFDLYDSSGTILQRSYTFTGSVVPEVTLSVQDNGFSLSDGTTTYIWTTEDEFLGLGLSSSFVSYSPGESYTFPGGSGIDLTYDLYIGNRVYVPDESVSFSDFGTFLTTVIGGFLGFELVPGFSLSTILEFFIVVWLLIAFFKLFS